MVSLSKGGKVSLAKEAQGSTKFEARLYWDTNEFDGEDFDLDVLAISCDQNLKALSDDDLVFYNNVKSPDGAIVHSGDNRTGEGDGADEVISVDLSMVNPNCKTIAFLVSIDKAIERGHNFGGVRNSKIEIYDVNTDKVVTEYWLEDDFSTETCISFGELSTRNGNDWSFKAVGQGSTEGLANILSVYGVDAN